MSNPADSKSMANPADPTSITAHMARYMADPKSKTDDDDAYRKKWMDYRWKNIGGRPYAQHCIDASDWKALDWCFRTDNVNHHWACCWAVQDGRIDLLMWVMAAGCQFNHSAAYAAGYANRYDMIKAAGLQPNVSACAGAAWGRHLDLLKQLHGDGFPLGECVCSNAAASGDLLMLQWARGVGCPWNEDVCAEAAEKGHLPVLKWARANGCLWDTRVCRNAATRGDLFMLRWARREKCPWDETTCLAAAKHGHLEVLQWARQANLPGGPCPWNWRLSETRDQPELLEWAHNNGCPGW